MFYSSNNLLINKIYDLKGSNIDRKSKSKIPLSELPNYMKILLIMKMMKEY